MNIKKKQFFPTLCCRGTPTESAENVKSSQFPFLEFQGWRSEIITNFPEKSTRHPGRKNPGVDWNVQKIRSAKNMQKCTVLGLIDLTEVVSWLKKQTIQVESKLFRLLKPETQRRQKHFQFSPRKRSGLIYVAFPNRILLTRVFRRWFEN